MPYTSSLSGRFNQGNQNCADRRDSSPSSSSSSSSSAFPLSPFSFFLSLSSHLLARSNGGCGATFSARLTRRRRTSSSRFHFSPSLSLFPPLPPFAQRRPTDMHAFSPPPLLRSAFSSSLPRSTVQPFPAASFSPSPSSSRFAPKWMRRPLRLGNRQSTKKFCLIAITFSKYVLKTTGSIVLLFLAFVESNSAFPFGEATRGVGGVIIVTRDFFLLLCLLRLPPPPLNSGKRGACYAAYVHTLSRSKRV